MSKTIEERAQEIRQAALSGYAWNVPTSWEGVHRVARGHWIQRAYEQAAAEMRPVEQGASTPQSDPAKYALRRMDGE